MFGTPPPFITSGKPHKAGGRVQHEAQKIRQDDAAGSIGVSGNFLGKVERGGETVQWGKLFQVLEGLGIHVSVDVPESVAAYLQDAANHKGKP